MTMAAADVGALLRVLSTDVAETTVRLTEVVGTFVDKAVEVEILLNVPVVDTSASLVL